jgi:hypothetical protein
MKHRKNNDKEVFIIPNMEEFLMKKIYLLTILMLIMFLPSCSSHSGMSYVDPTKYDIWNYLVSDTTITKNFDKYDTDANFHPTNGPYLNVGQVRETVLSISSVKYEEIYDGEEADTKTFTLGSDTIKVSSGDELNRYVYTNSSVEGDCYLKNHYNTYSPADGYTYSDVLEIYCGDHSIFYSKRIGLVVVQDIVTSDDGGDNTTSYSIRVANLE